MGTGWTLAVAAAFAVFKSFRFEPIYLWTLGAMALGWAGILRHALAAEQGAADAALAAAYAETRGTLDGMARAMGAQMQRASAELLRVDELLTHAIEQLMSAFSSMSEEASRQRNELAQAAADAQGTPAEQGLRDAAKRVARNLNGAITAMQFRDVVGQKLGHVRRELEALEQMMDQICELSATQSEPETVAGPMRAPGQARLAHGVRGLLHELEQARACSPAQQELMHAGEIDLF